MTHAQDGQTLVIFAIVCAFMLLGTIALVGNTQVLFVNSDRVDAAALLAAQAGASAIDQGALYSNQVVVSPAQAMTRCQQAGAAQATVSSVSCTVSGNTVTATIVERVQMPIPLWGDFETVSATRSARPAFGGVTGGF
jgi:hypothetical protein